MTPRPIPALLFLAPLLLLPLLASAAFGSYITTGNQRTAPTDRP